MDAVLDHAGEAARGGTDAGAGADLLCAADPPPFELYNPDGRVGLLVVCDHASRCIPRRLGDLGLPAAAQNAHIAWDPGAATVTRRLADRLDAPAVLGGYSRLVVDCNRTEDDPTAIPAISDGIVVPGNRRLDAAARTARFDGCHRPYHRAVAKALDRMIATHDTVAFFSVHSFTPRLRDGSERQWDIGVLWNEDARLPAPLMATLRQDPALCVGDNEPYSARDLFGHTVEFHAEPRGLPHALIEIRQDHLADTAAAERWGDRLAEALTPVLRSLGVGGLLAPAGGAP